MNWEVPTMKSKISFFNRGVAKNLLHRFWPLWLAYFALLLFSFSFQLLEQVRYRVYMAYPPNYSGIILENAVFQVYIGMVVAVLTAMAMFSYLYNSRSCGMMNALPIRRETMFSTAFLVGLMPLLLAQTLSALLAFLMTLGAGIPFPAFLKWLGISAMGMTAFYGMAVFCAMLTGNILVLPLVYAVLNLTAVVAEGAVRGVLHLIVYGNWVVDSPLVLWLSPVAKVYRSLNVFYRNGDLVHPEITQINGVEVLAIYCAAGLVLAVLALLLYRKRRMESATDVVAIPVLKPVFRYCMAFGTAFVLTCVTFELLDLRIRGTGAFLLVLLLLLFGAFLGYFVAQMLMKKTVKVFSGPWKGLLITWALLLIFAFAAEWDLTGYEKRVPAAEDVESVTFNGSTLSQPENIQAVVDLHRAITEHKDRYDRDYEMQNLDGTQTSLYVPLTYQLKNGRTLLREYALILDRAEMDDPTSDGARLQALANVQEVIDQKVNTRIPVAPENIQYASLDYNFVDESGYMNGNSFRLTGEQAVEFYEQGILPDAAEGHLIHVRYFEREDGQRPTNVNFNLNLTKDASNMDEAYFMDPENFDYRWFVIYEDSRHCLDWLAENTGIPVCLQSELEDSAS